MPDLSNIAVKERNAEYFYESFDRFYRSGNYTEACMSLWKALDVTIAAIASFENIEIKNIIEAKNYLQRFVIRGEISLSEVSSLEAIYNNRLRSSGDDSMLSIHIERTENLFRKLKKILKDYLMNGPPREPTKSALADENSELATPSENPGQERQNYGEENKGGNYDERTADSY